MHSRTIATCLVVLTLAAPALGSAQTFTVGFFRPWAGYGIPNGVWLTGDFNGDGEQDIAHAVQGTDYIHVWSSNGAGAFTVTTFRPWAGYGITNGVWLTGDFNGDGRTDLFHAVANTDYAHVWLSTGSGNFNVTTFKPWSGYGIPNGLWLTGDFNGDGRTDVLHAVANTDYVHIWTANPAGDGTFAVSTFRPWQGYGIPNGVWLIGDFNGDKRSDVFHAVQNTDYAHVWTSNGNGTFSIGTVRPWAGYGIPNGLWLTGDFNGDGRTDVLHSVQNTDYVHVWTATGGGNFSVGTFRPWAGYGMANGLWIPGDYDGDGRTDIVHAVNNTNYVHLWRSSGGGSFNVSTFSPWAGYGVPNGLWLPLDFTGDGKMDIVHAVQNTDYVHPWTSVIPSVVAGVGQVAVEGIEVTQVVQDMPHSVPLVAGKITVARVYLSTGTSATLPVVNGVLTVRDPVTNASTTVASTGSATLNAAQNGQLRPKRENLGSSLVFLIPAAFTNVGMKEFTLTSVSNASGGGAVTCTNCNALTRAAGFINTAPVRLRVVGLSYPAGTPPVTRAPVAADFALVRSWVARAFPIASLIATQTTIASTSAWPFTCNQANTQLAAQRALDVNGGTDARTHYLGLVSNGGGFMRGCSSGVPAAADPTVVASGPTGPTAGGSVPVNVTGDTDASFGDWYGGHELLHTFGRNHPGFCPGNSASDPAFPFPNGQISPSDGSFSGLDVGDATNAIVRIVLPGAARFDIMTYCNQPQWMSPYTYVGLRSRANAENPVGTGARAASATVAAAASNGRFTQVSARDLVRFDCRCGPLPRPARLAPPVPVTGARRMAKITLAREYAPELPEPAEKAPEIPRADPYQPDARPALAFPPEIERARELVQARFLEPVEPPPQVQLRSGKYVNIVASVNLTRNTAQIRFVNQLDRALVPVGTQSDRARIRVRGGDGRVIREYPVWLREDTDVPPNEDQTGLIDAVIPFDQQIRRVELLLGTRLADSIIVSRWPPVVRQVRTSARRDDGPGWEVRWEASDADRDSLTFAVQTSADAGKTWQTVGVGVRERRLVITPDAVPGQAPALVRVIASDGWWSSAPAVARVQTARKSE